VISFTRLTSSIGAVAEGIRLSDPLDEPSRNAIIAGLAEHHVLFFRDQALTPVQHRDFAAHFGKLHIHPIYPKHTDAAEIIVLDTDLVDLQDNAMWHTDVTFSPTPPMGGVLVARMLPPQGGDTLWSGRRGLFVNDGFTTHINELTAAESRALLPMLYAHSSKPEFVVRWKWRDGDVAFWDNRLTQHYATDDYRPARRVMNRATIIGDRPI
jgi:alpha-ketoglutarate-dependent taurine dioxygenase